MSTSGQGRSRRRAKSRRRAGPALAVAAVAVLAAGGVAIATAGGGHPSAGPSAGTSGTGTSAAGASSGAVPSTAGPGPTQPAAGAVPLGLNAPYEYLGWGAPQSPVDVMAATGATQLTLGFVTSDGGCNPVWDGTRPLDPGGSDATAIAAIRAHGGDVMVSFGGASGDKLGVTCASADALAAAYRKVVDTYRLGAVDFDLENDEVADGTVRQRVVDAIGRLHSAEPGLRMFATFGVGTEGPDANEQDLIRRGAAAKLALTGWVGMPFDFGGHQGGMAQVSTAAIDGLARTLAADYGWPLDQAYRHAGLSSMNGVTDEADETVSPADFTAMLGYARTHHLARFTFWAVNRDRPCGAGLSKGDSCGGIAQQPYAFTRTAVGYRD
ncbi:chitinase [Streptacidiphilus sp. EB129]|uniref:chitinase n=1 Tax=Streptacidiphilus sp. EB129 TaxID=3156262 RepID=UPI003517FBBB